MIRPFSLCRNVRTQDPTLTFGTCRNPLIRLAFQEITDHQQGDGMIS